MPLMSVSFAVILLFTVLTTLKRDPVKGKPWEAALGVICPLMSLAASFGLLFWVCKFFGGFCSVYSGSDDSLKKIFFCFSINEKI